MERRCWVNFQCRGVLLVWMIVGQGPIALAVGAGGGCLDIFSLIYLFSFLSPSLWETARYKLKYCLKGPLSPKQPTNQLLRTQTFHNLNVHVYLHSSLNSSRGVIRCPDLRGCSEQEILDEMKSQGVTAVKRFRVTKDGQLKDTNTFVFTFNTPVLPTTIKIAFLNSVH